MNEKLQAELIIYALPYMSRNELLELGTWLHDRAQEILLMESTDEYENIFTARYWKQEGRT